MKTYSKEYYRCPYCHKMYKGIIPKYGDGSSYIFPKHSVIVPFTNNREKTYCHGSHEEVKDED